MTDGKHTFLLLTLALWLSARPTALAAATDPALQEPAITQEDRQHWAFRPLDRPRLPDFPATAPINNAIDIFVVNRLQEKGLQFAPEADRATLIRRLSFDLIGLPPSPQAVGNFVNNPRPSAYDEAVERFLAMPQYGERWAQHWLDLARFAESDGFEHDVVRENAWQYRDWVIAALNRDLPYDQFLTAQLAGDESGNPAYNDALATGFLVAGPDMPDINLTDERRHNVLNEMTATVGAVFMGLGVGCAQCHDHKFDPFSQADFYRLRSFFDNMTFPKRNKQLGHVISETSSTSEVSYLAVRGDFRRQGPALRPGFPRIMNPSGKPPVIQPTHEHSSFRRASLANWLTQANHPLTSRVIVNRLWQHHFGQPLARTPNDFGTQGQAPSHPKLLDYLATELVAQEWSLKQMHRLIVKSRTYRQASRGEGPKWEQALEKDPDNQIFSRMNRRRLTGETLRDTMLSVAGLLNLQQGGPSVRPPLPSEVHATLLRKNHWVTSPDPADHDRRSLYIFVRRNLRFPMFDVFDRPDTNASCAQRSLTTTAPQSLNLLNSSFSLQISQELAKATLADGTDDPKTTINTLFQRTLGRSASPTEQQVLQAHLSHSTDQTEALTEICLALLNLNELLYVD